MPWKAMRQPLELLGGEGVGQGEKTKMPRATSSRARSGAHAICPSGGAGICLRAQQLAAVDAERACPVIQRACGEARNNATSATSSAVPKRPKESVFRVRS